MSGAPGEGVEDFTSAEFKEFMDTLEEIVETLRVRAEEAEERARGFNRDYQRMCAKAETEHRRAEAAEAEQRKLAQTAVDALDKQRAAEAKVTALEAALRELDSRWDLGPEEAAIVSAALDRQEP